MASNNTTWSPEVRDYTCVRFYVSLASFLVLLVFNLVINWTIVSVEHLRSHTRFVLVFHLLLSALVYLGMSSAFHYQIHLRARPGRPACQAMITVLISSGSNILLTLTVMALDRYCAVCHPMGYSARFPAWYWPWLLGALTWLVALIIPLSLLPHPDPAADAGECGSEQLRRGELQKVVFIGLCALLILFSYVRILVEGRRIGVLNRRNRAGCRTIALHCSQLAVFILPNFVNFVLTVLLKRRLIRAETKALAAVVIFTFFSLAQCVAPVVYGLRKEELLEQLGHKFPFCFRYLKTVSGWTALVNWTHAHFKTRARTLTSQMVISLEDPEAFEEAQEEETRSVTIMTSSLRLYRGRDGA